jgi:hypothetical protein
MMLVLDRKCGITMEIIMVKMEERMIEGVDSRENEKERGITSLPV